MKSKTKYESKAPIETKRALGYLFPICLAAILFAALFVSVANDMYAFVKPDLEVSFVITEPLSDVELSQKLSKEGVIKNDFAFTLYLRSKGKAEKTDLLLGEWTLNSNMSYREIVARIY